MPVYIDLPPVPGDPAGMAAAATAYRWLAGSIAELARDVKNTAVGFPLAGPFANRFHEAADIESGRAKAMAERLDALSTYLAGAARSVAELQAVRAELLERMQREAADRQPGS